MQLRVFKESVFDYPSAYWVIGAQKETQAMEALQKVCEQVYPI